MKKLIKNVALSAMALAIATPVFAAKQTPKNKDGTKDVTLWYGPAVSEAGAPPANWKVYNTLKKELKINLVLTALPSGSADQNTKINAAGAANQLPDLFMVSEDVFHTLTAQGLVACVDNMYKMMKIRTKKQYDADAISFTTEEDGHSYGLASPGSIIKNEGVVIRNDWLKKLGLAVPVTTDDYINVMKAFTENDPDGNGKKDTWGYGAYIETGTGFKGLGRCLDPFFGAFGVAGTFNLSNAKDAGLNILKPEYYDAVCYIKKLCDMGIMDPNWLAYKKDDYRAAWKQGKFGIHRESMGGLATEAAYKPFDKNFPDGEWLTIEAPRGPTGKRSVGVYDKGYRIYCLSKARVDAYSDKMALVAKLLDWMSDDSSTKKGYYTLAWGEEGVNYVLNKKGVPTVEGLKDPSKGFTKPEIAPITQLRNMVYVNSGVEVEARYPVYKCAKKENSAAWYLKDMQAKEWTKCLGMNKMPKMSADVDRMYQQGLIEFMTGKRELSKEGWAKFITEFKQIGGADYEKEAMSKAKAMGIIK